jgi:glycerate 2-kinase
MNKNKILIACDKFKGSLSALEACQAIEMGIKIAFPEAQTVLLPLADGGEGTFKILTEALRGSLQKVKVRNPVFQPIQSSWGITADGEIAFMEMAQASGLLLLSDYQRNPTYTTTLGTGEMMLDAIQKGVKKIVLGIGGSATNDAGMGMAVALGYQFFDKNGKRLLPIGKSLLEVEKIDDTHVVKDKIAIEVACDVENPLYGENGAAYVYAKQKGASQEDIEYLDKGLKHFSQKVSEFIGKDYSQVAGAGAAGGLGFGLMAFCNAQLISGIDLVMKELDFDKHLLDTKIIFTGEGKIDTQTLQGKTVAGVIKKAKNNQIPVIALCGKLETNIENLKKLGLTHVDVIADDLMNTEDAMKYAFKLLIEKSNQVSQIFLNSFQGN